MMNLALFRKPNARLADYLPWACLVGSDTVLNKDGSLMRVLQVRGPDLENATDAECQAHMARLNRWLSRLGRGWALYLEAERRPVAGYPDGPFPDAASAMVEAERRAAFEQEGARFETVHHLTLQWLPPDDGTSWSHEFLFEKAEAEAGSDQARALDHLTHFSQQADRLEDWLRGLVVQCVVLEGSALLTYLHGTVSGRRHPVAMPEVPAYLDAWLADEPVTGGIAPKLGEQHLRTLTLRGFGADTIPGLLDSLSELGFAYRWMSRWLPLDRLEAQAVLTRVRRHWFAGRKSMGAILKEVLFQEGTSLEDPEAASQSMDADAALHALGQGHVSFGYLTITINVMDADAQLADEKERAILRVLNAQGLVAIPERLNAVEAWLSSLPGQVYANIRQPLLHSLNLAHLLPVSAVWAGPEHNSHLEGPPLLIARTGGATPFRLVMHVGDVGHTLIVGPTGAGKSVLLGLLALQFRRYPGNRVILLDRGASARAAILAMGGRWLDPADPSQVRLQPLRHIHKAGVAHWAQRWIEALLAQQRVLVTPEIRAALWSALQALATSPVEHRTITGFLGMLGSATLREALAPFALGGATEGLLDGIGDTDLDADVIGIETGELMGRSDVAAPVISLLLHRLEAGFDGRPTLLLLDEAWGWLDHPLFAATLRAWLKTLRKKNVSVVVATQSLADLDGHPLASALVESCPSRLFLANARAREPQIAHLYQRFGLSERQIEILSAAEPKRHYFLQSPLGTRLFELGLGPIALALCAAGRPEQQVLIDQILVRHGAADFLPHWLEACGLGASINLSRGVASANN